MALQASFSFSSGSTGGHSRNLPARRGPTGQKRAGNRRVFKVPYLPRPPTPSSKQAPPSLPPFLCICTLSDCASV